MTDTLLRAHEWPLVRVRRHRADRSRVPLEMRVETVRARGVDQLFEWLEHLL